jgi:hypothetical protein
MFDVSKEKFQQVINDSSSFREAIRKMGQNDRSAKVFYTFKDKIKEWDIDISLLEEKRTNSGNTNQFCKVPDKEVFVKNSTYRKASVKKRLYAYKENKCSICGFDGNWNGKPIVLIMDHINGDRYDDRLENLRFVCPMCNSQLPTHCGSKTKKYYYCECGGIKDRGAKKCKKCSDLSARKVKERPSLETLLAQVEKFGYKGTGKKYGVIDNTVRKWIRGYGVEPPRKRGGSSVGRARD